MSRPPFVSVIILNRNGKEYLEDCLPSVEGQVYPRDRLEIIVVDNGSTDDSVSYIRDHHPRVVVVRKKRNEGYAAPNNEAARMAGGEHVVFLNNDIRLEPHWLVRMQQGLRVDKGVVCVGSRMLSWEGDRVDYAGRDRDRQRYVASG